MTHDIDDLLEIIKQLEERILVLESQSSRGGVRGGVVPPPVNPDDSWYWEHG